MIPKEHGIWMVCVFEEDLVYHVFIIWMPQEAAQENTLAIHELKYVTIYTMRLLNIEIAW